MAFPLVLRLNKSGNPLDWLTPYEAACLIVKDQITWHLGASAMVLHGGINGCGQQTVLDVPAIIATRGEVHYKHFVPLLTNSVLFRRDHQRCLYCGNYFSKSELTRDHIVPRSLGGHDRWKNVVTACRRCNHRKGARTPEGAGMPLLAIPYAPNKFEFMVMANRRILADQMEFLQSGFSKNYRPQ